ncbi:MAG: hypothetical protein R3F43_30105 [bacterium]
MPWPTRARSATGPTSGGLTCQALGFDGGRLACTAACTLDSAGCSRCGDGVVSGAEACDGEARGPRGCAALGFDGGEPGCTAACRLDPGPCTRCGDGVRAGGELCDGDDHGGATCESLGFDGGALACGADCRLDTSGCTRCGDGRAAGREACDGADRAGQTCATRGYDGGELGCDALRIRRARLHPLRGRRGGGGRGLRRGGSGFGLVRRARVHRRPPRLPGRLHPGCVGVHPVRRWPGRGRRSLRRPRYPRPHLRRPGGTAGAVVCAEDCSLDSSGCVFCGDGVRGGERL